MKFTVDVKAFINVTVEAPEGTDEATIRAAADRYVEESLSPTADETNAWADVLREDGETVVAIDASSGFAVDGESEVEQADD